MKHCKVLNQDSKLMTKFELPDNDVTNDNDDNDDNARLFSACQDCLGLVLWQNHQWKFLQEVSHTLEIPFLRFLMNLASLTHLWAMRSLSAGDKVRNEFIQILRVYLITEKYKGDTKYCTIKIATIF